MTKLSFPNETAEYRVARDDLLRAEIELRDRIARVAEMRARLPMGGVVPEDYVFEESDGDSGVREVTLSGLFEGGKDALFLYGFMYGPQDEDPCPMCSSLLDALNGNAVHIGERVNLAVVARAPVERIAAFARDRGWRYLRLLSSRRNTYHADYFAETESGAQMPMANVFVRRDGAIHHFWGTELLYADVEGHPRHMDLMWPLWNVLDATPGGRGDWFPPLRV